MRSKLRLFSLSLCCLLLGACTEDTPLHNLTIVDLADQEEDTVDEDSSSPDLPEETGCNPQECDIQGLCYTHGQTNPENPCEVCLVLEGGDSTQWSPQAGACDDGNPCTTDDTCRGGSCVGEILACDDGNPCTDDLCDPSSGECVGSPNEETCDDGNPCTTGDLCLDGACSPGPDPTQCDDGNPCTANSCDAEQGCISEPLDGGECDDENACTTGDTCQNGTCAGTEEVQCDDGNACTIDFCDPEIGACATEDISHLCNDENACTNDSCNPERGCVYDYNDDPCDDGSVCTAEDTCTQGVCRGNQIPLTNDTCLAQRCDPLEGVSTEILTGPCDDGNACTVGDRCEGGSCVTGTEELRCEDDNPCTDNACDPGTGCIVAFNDAMCDDGNACTRADQCSEGECSGSTVSCDDGNACTADSCDPETGCQHTPVLSRACRPSIVVDFPPRAATLISNDAQILVEGSVQSDAGRILDFTLNGEQVLVRFDNSFSHTVDAQVGGNVLHFEATDALGSTRSAVRSFLFSTEYLHPDADDLQEDRVEPGLGMFLSREVLDDGDHSDPPNDFASVFEKILSTYDLGALIPNPAGEVFGFEITIGNLTHSPPRVSLQPENGQLRMSIVIANVDADVFAGRVPGSFTNSGIYIDALVDLDANNDQLVINLQEESVQVSIEDPQFALNNSFLDFIIGWLIDSFVPGLVSDLETDFRAALVQQIQPVLADALGALALDQEIELPSLAEEGVVVPVRLKTTYQAAELDNNGLSLSFTTHTSSPSRIPHDNLGYPRRVGCLEGPQVFDIPGLDPFELVLSDDTLNGIFYSAWRGGFLEFELPESLLEGVDLSAYNIENLSLTASGLLPPVASDCNPSRDLLLHVGDLRIDANMDFFGQPLHVVVHASLEASLVLASQEDGLAFQVEDIRTAEFEIEVQQEDLLSVEPTFAEIIETSLIPGLLEVLGGESLGSIPLPSINLSEAIEGLEEDIVITIAPERVERDQGNTVISGDLQ